MWPRKREPYILTSDRRIHVFHVFLYTLAYTLHVGVWYFDFDF